MKPRVPHTRASITELEVRCVTFAAANGWGSRCNEQIERYENSLKAHSGVKHAIAASSCTGALQIRQRVSRRETASDKMAKIDLSVIVSGGLDSRSCWS